MSKYFLVGSLMWGNSNEEMEGISILKGVQEEGIERGKKKKKTRGKSEKVGEKEKKKEKKE